MRPEEHTIPIFCRCLGSWQFSLRRRVFSPVELSRRYDRAAPGWERMLRRIGYPRAYETLLREVLAEKATVLDNRSRVLDCGSGTGALSVALARVLPGFDLDVIDLSPHMLELAGQRFNELGMRASLRRGDARRLPYDDDAFDLVMTAHMLEHMPDPGIAIQEMARVLKPGGLLLVCLTRRSFWGMFLRLKWRTHWLTPGLAKQWLHRGGLENIREVCPAEFQSLDGKKQNWFKQLSLACVGEKPRREHHRA